MGTSDLRWLLYTASALSILGTSLVFLEHLQDRRLWRRPARQLLVWLCVTDFMTAVVYLLPYAEQNDKVCFAQAVLGIYFPVASFLWTDCIALYVYLIVSSLNRRSSLLRSSKTLFRLFHFVSWSVPLVCAVAVGLSNHAGQDRYTETSGWCWVKSAEDYGDDDDDDDDDGTADSEDEARRNEIQQIFALFILILTISGVRFYYGQPLIPRGAAPRKKTRNLKSPGGRGGTNHKGRAKGKDV